MNEQNKKYLEYLQNQINMYQERLENAKKELKKSLDGNSYTIVDFGLSKYAEQITVITAALQILYNNLDIFNNIFITETERKQ